ncbi:MAG: hypothetical protein JJW00_01775 [Sulfurimonas sp.]|nr:hypothetical protein [Sulfurimonas sp.]
MALVYVFSLEEKVVYEDVLDDVVILSPSLYWYMLCSIPTRSMQKAKKIAQHIMSHRPSHFEEIVLYKLENNYDAYAYDKSVVKSILKELNLKNPKVYFANQLKLDAQTAIDDDNALYKFGDRVMEYVIEEDIPESSLRENYKELLVGQKHIKLFEKSGKNNKTFLLASLALFVLYIAAFSFDRLKTLSHIDAELAGLKTEDRSFYEMKSLIKKYKKLQSSSERMRSGLKKELKKDKIKTLSYQDGKFKVTR